MTIGERIKAAREARGWTQAELAARLGYAEVTISRLENGHHAHDKPNSRALMALERVLGTKLVK